MASTYSSPHLKVPVAIACKRYGNCTETVDQLIKN